ncbi:MAG: serine hydrolase domain-containing protein [Bacteroidota bacterium]
MKQLLFTTFVLTLLGCRSQTDSPSQANTFETDILSLKEYFHIPGMAILVKKGEKVIYENYLGYADIETAKPVDLHTIFPIMSLSKTFASTLCLQLAAEGNLDLDAPVNRWLPETSLPPTVTLTHLLSHTSEGVPGTSFNYSSRYSLISQILEEATGQVYEELLQERIIQAAGLSHTTPLSNQDVIDSLKPHLASPYEFYGETVKGHYDTGVSSASGLSATARDLAAFLKRLENGGLLSLESRKQQITPIKNPKGQPLPYALGIFSQSWEGKQLVWGYGQEDCFSSLMLSIPEEKLSLVLLANNNLMSNPPRLINGDIRYSLFALSFLKHYVYSEDGWSLPTLLTSSYLKTYPTTSSSSIDRQILLANALAANFLGQGFPEEQEKSEALASALLTQYPEITEYGNISTLHLLMGLSGSRADPIFQENMLSLGNHLLQEQPKNPYINIYMAFFYQGQGKTSDAIPYFQTIADAENYRPFWYTLEAWYELGMYYQDSKPELAKAYLQKVVDLGWNIGNKVVMAKEALTDWDG